MEKNDLNDLLKTNTEKMNFQQNMCFQMKNWAIVITLGIISLVWKDFKDNSNIVSICLHLPLLIFLVLIQYETNKWMRYFINFRERVKFLEFLIVNDPESIDKNEILEKYYYYHKDKDYNKDINHGFIKKKFYTDKWNKIGMGDVIYRVLLGLSLFSFIMTIIICNFPKLI